MKFFDTPSPRFPLASVSDYRWLAKKRLPRQLFDFIDGGAFDESTLKRNSADFDAIQLRKRVLKNVSCIDTSIELLGQKIDLPLIMSPVAFAGVYAKRGEAQAARAAEKSRIPFSLSVVGICSMEEIRKAAPTPFWYQFNIMREKSHSLELLSKARAGGCSVLLLTVDIPSIGARYRYERHGKGFLAKRVSDFFQCLSHPHWFASVRLAGGPLLLGNMPKDASHLPDLASMREWMTRQLCPSFTWKDLEWVRANWPGKIVLKGILDPEDALLAIKAGMDGIVVSNHGGRHIDSVPSTISILPAIAEAIGGRLPILLDGGIYKGLDILKALALGANACMIGRAWAFGLAARGQQGVGEVLNILKKELRVSMAQLGYKSLNEIDQSAIYRPTS